MSWTDNTPTPNNVKALLIVNTKMVVLLSSSGVIRLSRGILLLSWSQGHLPKVTSSIRWTPEEITRRVSVVCLLYREGKVHVCVRPCVCVCVHVWVEVPGHDEKFTFSSPPIDPKLGQWQHGNPRATQFLSQSIIQNSYDCLYAVVCACVIICGCPPSLMGVKRAPGLG